jgi:outer membrane protein TolC
MKLLNVFLILAVACALQGAELAAGDVPRVLGLAEALQLAEKAAPSLAASRAGEEQAHQRERLAAAGYYPSLDAAAVDSAGFPGSAPGLDGIAGLVASPYREGAGVDAFAKWDLVDLSTWYGVEAAKFQRMASQQDTRVRMASVDQQALAIYLEGVGDLGQRDAWTGLAKELEDIAGTVRHFVRNGQYAEVQQILIQDQLLDAQVQAAVYGSRLRADLARLGYFTGLTQTAIACVAPQDLTGTEFDFAGEAGASPLLVAAELRAKAAEQDLAKSSAQRLPKLEIAGSVGDLEGVRLVSSQDYSVYAGLTLPLFEGFRLDAEQAKSAAARDQSLAELDQARLDLADLTARYNQRAQEARSQLAALGPELQDAGRAVEQARQRYLGFLGPLSDLQQALKDQVGIESRLAESKASLLLATGSLRFLYGGGSEGLR